MKNIALIYMFCIFANLYAQEKVELPAPLPRQQIIHHEHYSLSYVEGYELPSWVAYELTKEEASAVMEYKAKYSEDPDVTTGSATMKDYKKSGYIMGQLVPVEHMMMSKNAVKESFYLSTIVPHKLAFNKYVWIEFAKTIKAWAYECGKLYVVTGPVLADSPFPTFGPSKVSIPERYYYVLLDSADMRGAGFVMRNSMASGTLKQFSMSIDEVEEITGIDFFPALPDDQENAVESKFEADRWNFEILEE
jgi:endonuclease G